VKAFDVRCRQIPIARTVTARHSDALVPGPSRCRLAGAAKTETADRIQASGRLVDRQRIDLLICFVGRDRVRPPRWRTCGPLASRRAPPYHLAASRHCRPTVASQASSRRLVEYSSSACVVIRAMRGCARRVGERQWPRVIICAWNAARVLGTAVEETVAYSRNGEITRTNAERKSAMMRTMDRRTTTMSRGQVTWLSLLVAVLCPGSVCAFLQSPCKYSLVRGGSKDPAALAAVGQKRGGTCFTR